MIDQLCLPTVWLLGQAISKARKALGLNQKELVAREMKEEESGAIAPQCLNDIEHGRSSLSSGFLIRQVSGAPIRRLPSPLVQGVHNGSCTIAIVAVPAFAYCIASAVMPRRMAVATATATIPAPIDRLFAVIAVDRRRSFGSDLKCVEILPDTRWRELANDSPPVDYEQVRRVSNAVRGRLPGQGLSRPLAGPLHSGR